jgi:hypothetical protein
MTATYQRLLNALTPLLIAFGLSTVCGYADEYNWGRFEGKIVARFLDDGRHMRIKEAFKYIDRHEVSWDVPAGMVTDGTSVPRFFWTIFAPFSGKYRAAAVVHDRYCVIKSRGWQRTHEMFYEAMRASGVDEVTAKAMYGAVYAFGPRWGDDAGRSPETEVYRSDIDREEFYRTEKKWIERRNPTIKEITDQLDKGKLPDS